MSALSTPTHNRRAREKEEEEEEEQRTHSNDQKPMKSQNRVAARCNQVNTASPSRRGKGSTQVAKTPPE